MKSAAPGRTAARLEFLVSMSESFDVIVVGYGLAGAISAIEAHDAGAKVLLIEKEPFAGGISICAGGGARIADDAAKAFS
jgi:succinate dehydrogenase/fumarate reductase flavoprotein subunit